MPDSTRIDLPPDPSSAALARRAVRLACASLAVDEQALVLCTSELVTNAVLHGSPPIELEVIVDGGSVRVAVHDRGPGHVERRTPLRRDTLSGRGLEIVDSLASAWGTERTATGKVAWFELTST